MEAVKQNWNALQYVDNKTEEICMEAVKKDWYTLRYINNQTEEICIEAVKQDPDAIEYIDSRLLKNKEYMTLDEVCEELGRDIKIVR